MKIKCRIWIEKDGHVLFGHGREELLKAIDEFKSLNAAAKKLNMSYRAAWGRLKASEERLGYRLVEHMQGRRMQLTPRGHALLRRFDMLEHKVGDYLQGVREEFCDLTGKKDSPMTNVKKMVALCIASLISMAEVAIIVL